MAKLTLQFGTTVLKEYTLERQVVTIGRSPQSTIIIDNPAVSHDHAKLYADGYEFYLEDLGSLNGTFLNGSRIGRALLRPGDTIAVGKHTIRFTAEQRDGEVADPLDQRREAELPSGPAVEKLDGTMILDTKSRRALQKKFASGPTPVAAEKAAKVGKLLVIKGRTTEDQYVLTSQTSIVGKSNIASVRLKGWFAPKVAAIITKRGETYFISSTTRKSLVNGEPVRGRRELKDGDLISLGRVQMQFTLVAW